MPRRRVVPVVESTERTLAFLERARAQGIVSRCPCGREFVNYSRTRFCSTSCRNSTPAR